MNRNFIVSDFYCTKCGNKGVCLPRKNGQYREAGHLKKIFCLKCQEFVNHVELRPFYSNYNFEDFELEMKYLNFDDDGNRKEPYKIFRQHLKEKGVI